MIFKTFDSAIDKFSSKIRILGKSFDNIGSSINNAFNIAINNIDDLDNNVGFWKTLKNDLFPSKEDIESQMRTIPDVIDIAEAKNYAKILKTIDSSVLRGG